jgi:hypothetical protein
MKKTVIILMCLLLLAVGVPVFAHGHNGHHGHHRVDNEHRWHGSDTHPGFHRGRGCGDAPDRDRPGKPAPEPPAPPAEDPGDKPAETPGEQPGEKGLTQTLILNPFTGSFPG